MSQSTNPSYLRSRRDRSAGLASIVLAGVLAGPGLADTHIVDATGGGDHRYLQDAIDASSSGDLILVRPGTYRPKMFHHAVATVPTTIAELTIRSTHGPGTTILRATRPYYAMPGLGGIGANARGVNWNGARGRLSGLTIEGGYALNGGGLHATGARLDVEDCRFRDNQATGNGGAIHVTSSGSAPSDRPRFAECVFENNRAECAGGSIYASGGLDLEGCDFLESEAGSRGGGVFLDRGESNVRDVAAVDCSARYGGFLAASGAGIRLAGGRIESGIAGQGGGVHIDDGGRLEATDVGFDGNDAGVVGGAVSIEMATAVFERVEFVGNDGWMGGAVHGWNADVDTIDCSWSDNDATMSGGAIALGRSTLSAAGNEFTLNRSDEGGVIHAWESSVHVESCGFASNSADQAGGAVSLERSSGTFSGCGFQADSASLGGAWHLVESDANAVDCDFSTNTAAEGGAIWSEDHRDRISLLDCDFDDNSVLYGHGGAIGSRGSIVAVGCEFTSNMANTGGHVFLTGDGPGSTFTECGFFDGRLSQPAYGHGGAVCATGIRGGLLFVDCIAEHNDSGASGGAFRIESLPGSGRLAIVGCDFRNNNEPADGGGFFMGDGGQIHASGRTVEIEDSVLNGQAAWGGAAYGNLLVRGSTLTGLSSAGAGAAVLIGRGRIFDSLLSGGSDGAIAAVIGGTLRNTVVSGTRSENFIGSMGYSVSGATAAASVRSATESWFGSGGQATVVSIAGRDSGNIKDGHHCLMDFDHDGDIDVADESHIEGLKGTIGWGHREDLDRDGDIDADDVALVTAQVGTSCS